MPPEAEPGSGVDRLDALMARVGKHCSQTERAIFGVQVPLRVCPLGAHIDHQGGRVTGMTIDRSVRLAGAPTDGAVGST